MNNHMKLNTSTAAGFSLVEMAIVLAIIGLLLGSLISPLSSQLERDQRKTSLSALTEISQALTGFALANDRLPCPATPNSAGIENPSGGGVCTTQHGFVPATTLGLSGHINVDGLLLDPWNNPYRYSITNSNGSAFSTNSGMVAVTMAALTPNLTICTTTTGSTPTACANAATTLSSNAVAIVYAYGKNWSSAPVSSEELENQGATLGAGPSSLNYPVANDIVFVNRDYSNVAGIEYDDQFVWLSPHILYNRLVAGGRL